MQEQAKSALAHINAEFSPFIVSGFSFTLGDEWQGLLKDLSLSYEILWELRRHFVAGEFHVGIGYGEITTSIGPIHEMDGPAFYRARDAIDESKASGYGVVMRSGRAELDEIVNPIIRLVESSRDKMTARQQDVIRIYEETKSMAAAAARIGVSKQSVSKILRAARWNEIVEARKAIGRLIKFFIDCDLERRCLVNH